MEQKLLPSYIIPGAEGFRLSIHATQLQTVGAQRLAVRFIKLASLQTVPTFFTSRETARAGRLPDLIKLKDIHRDRLGEASDPLLFHFVLFNHGVMIACRHKTKCERNSPIICVNMKSFLTQTICVAIQTLCQNTF